MTTLVVLGLNDGEAELRDIARFLADVDRDILRHISRFHPDYEYREAVPTPIETSPGGRHRPVCGLRFIYTGNISGEIELTCCPRCRTTLIRRRGFDRWKPALKRPVSAVRRSLPGVFPAAAVPSPL